MSGMIDKINQENKDLAEIEKVARFDAKGMLWQWVSVGKWFLGGGFVSLVLHIVLSNLFDDTWFDYPLNSTVQGFINKNIIETSFWIFFLPVILWFGFIWLRKYWNQISANFLEVNLTESLIFAGFGFWVGLEILGFEFEAGRFAIELWSWQILNYTTNINFYFFRDLSEITWNEVYLTFYYLAFILIFLRTLLPGNLLVKKSLESSLNLKLDFPKIFFLFHKNNRVLDIYTIIYILIFLISGVFLYPFILLSSLINQEYTFFALTVFWLLAYNLILILSIFFILNYNPRLFEFYSTYIKSKKIVFVLVPFLFFKGYGLLLKLKFPIFFTRVLFTISIPYLALFLLGAVNFGIFLIFIQFPPLVSLIIWGVLILYLLISQIVISDLIYNLLKSAKKTSLIPCEEPTQKYAEVKKILGGDSQFLKEVDDFVIKKILNYPYQNLQNRSEVYCIDGAWGTGKSSFIGLVKDKIYSQEVQKNSPLEGWQPKADGVFLKLQNFFKDSFNSIFYGFFEIKEILDLKNRQGENNIIWVDFNPWNYLTADKLVADFFDTLENRIGKIYGGGLSKSLNKYVKILISSKPSLFGFGLDFSYNPLVGDQDLNILKDQIQTKLRSIKEKIVIVIDDLDRLPPETVLTVLKLVGITANFPNIFFVLAMDYDKVEKIVQKELGEQYQNYLQKIVNQRVPLPKWSYEELGDMFGYYTKNAVEEFGKLGGLEGFDGWLEFEGNNKQSVKILENYVTQVFIKVLLKKIQELEKNKRVSFDKEEKYNTDIIKINTTPFENLGLVEKIAKQNFKLFEIEGFLFDLISRKDFYSLKHLGELIVKKSPYTSDLPDEYYQEDIDKCQEIYEKLKDFSEKYIHSIPADYTLLIENSPKLFKKFRWFRATDSNLLENLKELVVKIDSGFKENEEGAEKDGLSSVLQKLHREIEKLLHICEIILIKDELENYSNIVKNEISITPRDIKQLATKYIYGVAEVYDKLVKKWEGKDIKTDKIIFDKNSAEPEDFQTHFKKTLNNKLPEIVQETVDSQFFGIG